MSSNLLTGLHTRLEGSRKFLFGNACVYGVDNDSAIRAFDLFDQLETQLMFSRSATEGVYL